VCLVSIVRLTYLVHDADHPDFSFDQTVIAYWTCVEPALAIVVACTMTLWPLVTKLFPRVFEEPSLATSDPEQRAPYSIGGRPLWIGSDPAQHAQKERDSWTDIHQEAIDIRDEIRYYKQATSNGSGSTEVETQEEPRTDVPGRPGQVYLSRNAQ